jgi:hypothetical protein
MSKLSICSNTPFHHITGNENSWKTIPRIAVFLLLLFMGESAVWSQTTNQTSSQATNQTTQWTIDKIVDGTTKCPGTSNGYFNPNREFPAINGEWVVFEDEGNDGCAANDGPSIWSYNLATKKLTKLVDTGTEVRPRRTLSAKSAVLMTPRSMKGGILTPPSCTFSLLDASPLSLPTNELARLHDSPRLKPRGFDCELLCAA